MDSALLGVAIFAVVGLAILVVVAVWDWERFVRRAKKELRKKQED